MQRIDHQGHCYKLSSEHYDSGPGDVKKIALLFRIKFHLPKHVEAESFNIYNTTVVYPAWFQGLMALPSKHHTVRNAGFRYESPI